MALTPDQQRRMRVRRMNLLMAYASFASSKAVAWTPAELFAQGEQGVWYDPSDMTTLFQDAAGTIPVTAVEQPVGLMLDKSQGLVLGPELVTNGDFSNGTTGWVASGSTISIVNDSLRVTENGLSANPYGYTSITTTSGRWYQITVDVVTLQMPHIKCFAGSTFSGAQYLQSTNVNTTGSKVFYFLAGGNTTFISFVGFLQTVGGTTEYFDIDNVSVRELPGNHASQSTSASRPVLSARVNLLTKTEEFDNAVWTNLVTGTGVSPVRTANAGIAPNGTLTADRFQFSRTTAVFPDRSAIQGSANVSFVQGVQYTASFWAKSFSGATQSLNLTLNANGVTIQTYTITADWQRFTYTFTSGPTFTTPLPFRVGLIDAGTALSSDVLLWGADLRVTNVGVNLPAYQRVGAATAGTSTTAGNADYDTTGFPMYLRFDGTDDSMATGSIDFSGTDKMAVIAGVRKLNTGSSVLVELSANISANNGSFVINSPASSGFTRFASKGTTLQFTDGADVSPSTAVASGLGDISGDQATLRLNGAQVGQSVLDQGTGNYGNYPLYVASRDGSSLRFNGHIYGLVIVGRALTAGEIASMETWMNSKTKAF